MSLLDCVFSPGWVGGKDWQSSSFSGEVFIKSNGSSNKWCIWSLTWMLGRFIDLERVCLACYDLCNITNLLFMDDEISLI